MRRAKIITVRFFIPPAVVESKGFAEKPVGWMLGWEVEGVEMPVDVERFPDNFSKKLQDRKVFETFKKFIAEGASSNEGIMLPPYHGPSGLQPKNDNKDFAFVRKDP